MRRTSQDKPDIPQRPTYRRTDSLGMATCLAVAVLVAALSWFKLASLDTGYHLAYGRHFLETGRIVDRDPFLLPEIAEPFINANWGSQVLMALAEHAAGAGGLIALRIILISIIFTCIVPVVRHMANTRHPKSPISNPQSSISPWLAWAGLLAGLAAYERFSMRPELFSYALTSVLLVLLARGIRSRSSIAAVAVLQLAWVNLHSYFLVGPLLTGTWLIGDLLRGGRPATTSTQPGRPASRRGALALALVLQLGVCVINPWHYRGAIFPIKTLQFLRGEAVMGGTAGDASDSAWAEISEFQSPFSFHGQIINARTIHAYYVLLAVTAFGLIALLARRQFGPALAVAVLFAMSTQMRRNIALFALAAAPLSIGALAAAVPWSMFHRLLRRFLRPILLAATLALAAWWTYGIVCGRFYYVERRITRRFGAGYSERTFHPEAVRWLAAHPSLTPNLFVDYFSSSNTLPWLPDRFKLFVDTNTFAYKDDTLKTAFQLGLGQNDHNRFFGRYDVNVVLLHCGPDTQMLVRKLMADDSRWALVYFDRHSVIFIRRTADHEPGGTGVSPVVTQHPPSSADLDARAWIASLAGPPAVRALSLGTIVNVPMSLGWSEPASVLLDEALRLAPDYHEAWHYLGVCHGNLGNAAAKAGRYDEARRHWTRALRCFATVLALKPDHRDAAAYRDATSQRLMLLRDAGKTAPRR